jgi:predicted Rossmann fold nucleotide-binding protein DprA/Smf involved in DNA uptake
MTRVPSQERDTAIWTNKQGDKDLFGIGDKTILTRKCLGLICSVKCPGSVVIKTFDSIRELRDAGVVVACGFHSPIEQQCLEFLMRGEQPVIAVLAKGMGRPRLPIPWAKAIEAGRMLIISPFSEGVRRTTKSSAHTRNQFIIGHATAVLIPHASPGGNAEAIARTVIEIEKPLFTFADEENKNLHQLGARPLELCVLMRDLDERETS